MIILVLSLILLAMMLVPIVFAMIAIIHESVESAEQWEHIYRINNLDRDDN